jgi:predicted ATPase/DNA-binding SARP family transcriptional activator
MLGPLAVWTSDARPVRIPELKVRALLAELVAEAGQTVPADRLIDHLWGERLPAKPTNALQAKVSQLRRALDEAAPDSRQLVESSGLGYCLTVHRDAVDAGRFETLLAKAQAATSPRARVVLLGDALALWRGPVLADFADEEFVRPVAARLDELRLTALELRAEARLALGENGLLADELGDLVARHPLRERLRAAHLRALYRAGRQSEALDGYRDLHAQLDAVGVEPAPELVELHRAILTQDPALGATTTPAPTNLPHPLGGLVGRADAVRDVLARLATDRLVTLTGPGGVGKTRLALAAARELVDEFADGVWLVELGALPTGAARGAVDELVAAVLEIRDEQYGRLAEAVRAKRLLLVFDNCEHVVDAVAELAAELLAAAPELRVLATGQVPLDLAGEVLWPVPPLPEPSAVELFVARAAAGVPGFAVDEDNAAAIAAICRGLDGIPLALELAATRVRTLGVHEVAARLDDRFRLLSAGRRGAPERQRTLRAVLEWSWELLEPADQELLRRMAVFRDGATLSATYDVCGPFGSVERLVDRSLVTVDPRDPVDQLLGSADPTGPRYRLLESVREYAVERLEEAGELPRTSRLHHAYYAELAATADPHLRGPEQRAWLRRLDAETANLHAALDHAVAHGAALPLVNSLAWYWVLRGRLREGHRWFTAALATAPADDADGAGAIARTWQAGFAVRLGLDADAVPPADVAALPGRALAEWFMAFARVGIGDPAATAALAERALAVFRAIGDQWGTAAALGTQARYAFLRSDLPALREQGTRSMALFTELGDQWGQLQATFALGTYAELVGDYEHAAEVHRDGLRMAEELGLWTEVSDKLSALGRIALLTGDHEQADALHERARRLAVEQSYPVGEEYAELGLALSERRQGRLDSAEARLRKWLEWDRRLGSDIAISLILAELGFIAEHRGDPAAATALHTESLAAAHLSADVRAVALALEGLAAVAAPARSARLLGRAAALRESVGAPLPAGERGDVDRITARAVAALGEDGFAAEFTAGRTDPTLEQST